MSIRRMDSANSEFGMMDFVVRDVVVARGKPAPIGNAGPSGSCHQLGQVHALNMVIEMKISSEEGDPSSKGGITKITLKQVPQFLVTAFNFITEPSNMKQEGIFRKEGNSARINKQNWAVYVGLTQVPNDFTVHDVCTMVKRFFRDLKVPLLYGVPLRKKLLALAEKAQHRQITRRELTELFDTTKEDGKFEVPLAPAHLGTLGYLMRQLNRIANHASQHQMTAENLATVFAPTLFKEEAGREKSRRKEGRRGSQEDLLMTMRSETEMKIAAIKMLIEKANWIGLSTNPYVTSYRPNLRSSSLTPSPRHPLIQMNQVSEDGGNGRRDVKLEKRQSLKNHKDVAAVKASNGRRSSSTLRELFQGFGRLRRRSRSKDEEPRRRTVELRRASSPGRTAEAMLQERGRIRSPRHTHTLDFEDGSITPIASSVRDESPVSARQSRSTQSRKPTVRHPTPGPSAEPAKVPSTSSTQAPRLGATAPMRRSSQRGREAIRPTTTQQMSSAREPDTLMNKAIPAHVSERKTPGQALKDNPVSMLGEEFFDANLRDRPDRQRRRHTTPVKINALRRNQPNTLHSGLPRPARRSTLVHSSEHEKENRQKRRSVSVDRPSSDDLDETSHARMDASDILEQKGLESRMRRVKRQKRKDSNDSLLDATMNSTLMETTTDSPVAPQVTIIRMEDKKMVSTASSPIVISSAPSLRTPGSAVVSATQVIIPPTPTSPQMSRLGPNRRTSSSSAMARLILSKSPEELRPQLPKQSTTESLRSNEYYMSPSRSSPTGFLVPDYTSSGTTIEVRIGSSPPPPLPVVPPPLFSQNANNMPPPSSITNVPRSPLRTQHSLDSALARNEAGREPRIRPALLPKPGTQQQYMNASRQSPIGRKGASASCLDSRIPLRATASTDDDFAMSDHYKNIIMAGIDTSENLRGVRSQLDLRPSVAFIRTNHSGMVKDRVNLFSQLSHMEPISGRSSAMSTRSSLGGNSSTGEAEYEWIKPSAPPVTHTITSGQKRLSGGNTLLANQTHQRSPSK